MGTSFAIGYLLLSLAFLVTQCNKPLRYCTKSQFWITTALWFVYVVFTLVVFPYQGGR